MKRISNRRYCIQCEIRETEKRYCNQCRAIQKLISKYWVGEGMPLKWDERPHKRLKALGTDVCTECYEVKTNQFRKGLCEACYSRRRRRAMQS